MNDRQNQLFPTDPPPWELDDAAERLVATVVFPEGVEGEFDYLAPETLAKDVGPGKRLRVPLGRGDRSVIGYCVRAERRPAGKRRLKSIHSVIDEEPLLSPSLLELTRWMSTYYLSVWGATIEAVTPAAVRGGPGGHERTFLRVPTKVAAKLTTLKLTPKQREVLEILAASPEPLTPPQLAAAADCTQHPISALRKKGMIDAEVRRIQYGDFDRPEPVRERDLPLNDEQQTALKSISEALHSQTHQTFLMHGVTGSGKTEVYIRAISEVIRFGRQAIVLVPEISLTPQTRQRFRTRFDDVAVLHSHLTPAERRWHWKRIAAGEVNVVVGARSAVFAPTPHLGLIVIDEEHDPSFKQDSSPRYHCRDVALFRARQQNIPLVLGSATPSLESWRKAREGEYRLLELSKRVMDRPLPIVSAIDLRGEFESRSSRGAVSRQLYAAMVEALQDEGQVILLLNRRGFSTNIQCPQCGYVVTCPHCDISLTHHREGEQAVCHYCEYHIHAPANCPDCGQSGIRYAGLGTQRLEEEVRSRFRGVEILRMDSDAMKKRGSHERALARFRSGEVKILLGTQMIAKGLDFPNVTLVGVINADTALHFPDFRASERTFQLVTQVAGRTGRGGKGGRVLVQTFSPDHPAIRAALSHDFVSFAELELPVRRDHGYPPYSDMIRIVVRGPNEKTAEIFCEQFIDAIRRAATEQGIEARVLGPAPAPIGKLKGLFRFHALLHAEDGAGLKSAISAQLDGRFRKPPGDVQWIVDVDPQSLL